MAGSARASFVLVLALTLPVVWLRTSIAADALQLPNLTAITPYDVQIGVADGSVDGDPRAPRALRFSVATRNTGVYSLELQATPEPDELTDNASRRPANQCVGWADRACTQTRSVGDLVWHEAHGHWHFEDYARYELRRLLPDGSVDESAGGLIVPGEKASFCLQDTDPPGSDPEQDRYEDFASYYLDLVTTHSGMYAGCTDTRQGISPGWADAYGFALPGQQIPLAGVPAGDYALVVTIDPEHRLYETSEGDNRAVRIVSIPADGATDVTPPISTISTPTNSVIVRRELAPVSSGLVDARDHVEGTATDTGSGIAYVLVRWRDPRGTTSSFPAELTCSDASRTSCTWTATNFMPGAYAVTVSAVDQLHNEESPGPPSISVINL